MAIVPGNGYQAPAPVTNYQPAAPTTPAAVVPVAPTAYAAPTPAATKPAADVPAKCAYGPTTPAANVPTAYIPPVVNTYKAVTTNLYGSGAVANTFVAAAAMIALFY